MHTGRDVTNHCPNAYYILHFDLRKENGMRIGMCTQTRLEEAKTHAISVSAKKLLEKKYFWSKSCLASWRTCEYRSFQGDHSTARFNVQYCYCTHHQNSNNDTSTLSFKQQSVTFEIFAPPEFMGSYSAHLNDNYLTFQRLSDCKIIRLLLVRNFWKSVAWR